MSVKKVKTPALGFSARIYRTGGKCDELDIFIIYLFGAEKKIINILRKKRQFATRKIMGFIWYCRKIKERNEYAIYAIF